MLIANELYVGGVCLCYCNSNSTRDPGARGLLVVTDLFVSTSLKTSWFITFNLTVKYFFAEKVNKCEKNKSDLSGVARACVRACKTKLLVFPIIVFIFPF